MAVVTLFGGSHPKEGDPEYEMARRLGKLLAEAGYTICNGGYAGVMEASARGAKEAGGKTIGVTTEDFAGPANRWIDQEIHVKKWQERLFKLIELGDAYVIFDGGTGTLAELFVVWEMSNKKLLDKPVVILGEKIKNLVERIHKIPQVMNNSNLYFSQTPAGAVQFIRQRFKEDELDLKAVKERRREPVRSYKDVVSGLKRKLRRRMA